MYTCRYTCRYIYVYSVYTCIVRIYALKRYIDLHRIYTGATRGHDARRTVPCIGVTPFGALKESWRNTVDPVELKADLRDRPLDLDLYLYLYKSLYIMSIYIYIHLYISFWLRIDDIHEPSRISDVATKLYKMIYIALS